MTESGTVFVAAVPGTCTLTVAVWFTARFEALVCLWVLFGPPLCSICPQSACLLVTDVAANLLFNPDTPNNNWRQQMEWNPPPLSIQPTSRIDAEVCVALSRAPVLTVHLGDFLSMR